MSEGPTIRRHRSSQAIETPWEFIHAVEAKFGLLAVDLAATAETAKCASYITPEVDTFKQSWAYHWLSPGEIGWLNPEFDPVDRWFAKCAEEVNKGARFVVLSRGSHDTNWFWDLVWPNAAIYDLQPRIKFVGSSDVYPSPLMLTTWGLPFRDKESLWRWK